MQLLDILNITGKIIVKTGLRIGAGDAEMRIGGLDNPIIKHPHTLEPYIPGSSLKGKVRSLLELQSGLIPFSQGTPLALKHLKDTKINDVQKARGLKIIKLFGTGGAEEQELLEQEIGPTRVAFADCALNNGWKRKAMEEALAFTEVKSENTINRITSVAQHPRQMERVPSGAQFDFRVTLKKFDKDQNDDLETLLLIGLKLLTLDALGGCGSRGYGRIEFDFDD
ncbi:MAG: type III-A CRISPR-associated RAMP protein Csm3, partial [Desulfobacca sp.]|uniref:type III-A CRISPR-associated RAMP protein Csm3 n=1 Tax=Desulfobacca sp. TaxID=2067990 RepID=UPI004049111E